MGKVLGFYFNRVKRAWGRFNKLVAANGKIIYAKVFVL